jgi:serine/threonine protein kinase
LLARVVGIIGPVPEYMMKEGRLVSNFFTREGLIYQETGATAGAEDDQSESSKTGGGTKKHPKRGGNEDGELKIHIMVPKKTTLKARVKCDDAYYLDFVRWLLEIDPTKRPSAKEALQHPWLTECVYNIE